MAKNGKPNFPEGIYQLNKIDVLEIEFFQFRFTSVKSPQQHEKALILGESFLVRCFGWQENLFVLKWQNDGIILKKIE